VLPLAETEGFTAGRGEVPVVDLLGEAVDVGVEAGT
jgi:hypothetical protein